MLLAGAPGYAAMDFHAGRIGVRGCTFGVELKNQAEGSVGLRMSAQVERAVVVGNDMLGSAVVSDVAAASAAIQANLA